MLKARGFLGFRGMVGRRVRLVPVWAIAAVVSLMVSSMVGAVIAAPAASATTLSTCGAKTGVLGGAETQLNADGSDAIVMTGSLFTQVCGTTGLFAPLAGQTITFAEEDEAGLWYYVCQATTDSVGVAGCSGTTRNNVTATEQTDGDLVWPPTGQVAAWSVVYPGSSDYLASSDYGQMPGVTQPGPGNIGTPPGAAGNQITITESHYVSGCQQVSQTQAASLFGLMTDGGNCQLAKIESDVTTAVFAAAGVVAGVGAAGIGFQAVQAAVEAAEAVAESAAKELIMQGIEQAGYKVATNLSGVLAAAVPATISVAAASTVGALVGIGTAVANGSLTIGSGDDLQIGTGATLQNEGVIYNEGSITDANISRFGSGVLFNDGTILDTGGSLPPGLTITGNNYTLNFQNPTQGATPPSPIHVLAPTVAASGQTLPTATPPTGEVFTGWTTSTGTPITNGTELASVLATGPSTTTLTANFGSPDVTITNSETGNACSGGEAGGGTITCGSLSLAIAYVESDPFFANHNVTIIAGSGQQYGAYTIALPTDVLSLTVQGLGDNSTTLNASDAPGQSYDGPPSSVFHVESGDVTISDMTITGGAGSSPSSGVEASGGGVLVTGGANVTLTNDTISNNIAGGGGGVYNDESTVTITDSLLSHDSASGAGGGVATSLGTTTLTNDTLVNDSASPNGNVDGGGGGGAVFNGDGTVNMAFDTLESDTSPAAGAIAAQDNQSGSVTVADSILDSAGCSALYESTYTGKIVDGGYNVESDNSCGFGPTSVVSADIVLGFPQAPNSTDAAVMGIDGDSPAALEVPLSACSVGADAAGDARPRPDAPACDAGAVDAQLNYPPSPPAVQSAFGGNGQATVTWSTSAFDGFSSVSSYTVTATDLTTSTNGGQTCTVNLPAGQAGLSCVVSGLTNGDVYTFAVTAYNGYTSVLSAASLPVQPAAPPGTPTITSVVQSGDPEATVSWDTPADDGGVPIVAYLVTATDLTDSANGGQQCSTLATDPNTCTIEGLVAGDQYQFSVAAVNDAIGSPPTGGSTGPSFNPSSVSSSPAVSPTVTAGTPGAPTIDEVTPGPDQAEVAWSAPTSDGGSPITGYMVTAVDGTDAAHGGQTCTTTDATSCTITGLTADESYTVAVVAENLNGPGAAATSSPVIPYGLPTPTVSITDIPTAASFSDGSFRAQMSTTSDGTPSVSSTTPTVCTVGPDGLTVTYLTVGTCTLAASVLQTTDYLSGTGQSQSFMINQGTPSGAIIDPLPSAAVYGASFVPTVDTDGDGVPSVASSTPLVCTVADGTVSFVGVGTCTLTASVAAGTDYQALAGIPQSFDVGPATPTTATITSLPGAAVYGASFVPTVDTDGDGVPSVASSTPLVCTVADGTVSFVGVGTCTLTASVVAGTDYQALKGSPESFVVGPAPSTLSVLVPADGGTATEALTGLTASVSGAGVKDGTITYYLVSGTAPTSCPGTAQAAGSATVTGPGPYPLPFTPPAAGTYFLYASYNGGQDATGTQSTCGAGMASFTVSPHSQQVNITSTAPTAPGYLATYPVTATGNTSSGIPITDSAGPPSVCTISVATVTFVGVGTCTIIATQAPDVAYSQGQATQEVVTVASSTLSAGATCVNRFLAGTFNGNVTVPAGATCDITSGATVGGNVTDSGMLTLSAATVDGNLQTSGTAGPLLLTGTAVVKGNLIATAASLTLAGSGTGVEVAGNLQTQGGGTVTITAATIQGNLQVKQQKAGSAQNEICATTVDGNLLWQSDPAPVVIGDPAAGCGADTINGNLEVHGDFLTGAGLPAAIVEGDVIAGNAQLLQLSVPTGTVAALIENNTIGGKLQVQQVTPSYVATSNRVKGSPPN